MSLPTSAQAVATAPCPHCGAAPGQPCRRANFSPMRPPGRAHSQRRDLARRLLAAHPPTPPHP